ncbi:hypothetical protein IVA95_33100 [Bradyrhizobium sp. 157]|uniref:hypothetical protein n=1 Tax=Bradyrhizobium sp. 157 TaxID=2782631 RepID=UPI001FFA4CDE|nr:hypothetical protein [Bradyrhizobium sp. 157]MCK1642263.1 hypothetical protein [Bradyrhizobium sp. 157]
MKQPSLRKAALAVSVFTCATMLSFDWSEQRSASLSIERAQAQTVDPLTPAPRVTRRQARRAAAGAAAVGAGAAAAGATAAYYGSGPYAYYRGNGPYGYYGGPGIWSQDYATRNGIICQPGTMVRLDDGLMHRCQ